MPCLVWSSVASYVSGTVPYYPVFVFCVFLCWSRTANPLLHSLATMPPLFATDWRIVVSVISTVPLVEYRVPPRSDAVWLKKRHLPKEGGGGDR